MIDHQIHRHQRLDDLGVLAETGDGRAHRRQVHQQGYAGEVLQDDPGHDKRDLFGALLSGLPLSQGAHMAVGHSPVVAIAHHRFQHHPQGNGQLGHWADARFLERRQRIKKSPPPVPKVKLLE